MSFDIRGYCQSILFKMAHSGNENWAWRHNSFPTYAPYYKTSRKRSRVPSVDSPIRKTSKNFFNISRADGVFLDMELFKKKCFRFDFFLLSAHLLFFLLNSLLLINF